MILVIATLFSMVPTTVFAATSESVALHPFTDVKAGDWYHEYVSYVWQYGIFNGITETTFVPDGKLTRAMFVTVLGRIAGVDKNEYTETVFDDVDPSSWYGPYVAWAAEYDITSGVGSGLFAPDANVTRQQIATFLYRFLQAVGKDVEGAELTYVDADKIAVYARDGAAVCLALGLIRGDTLNRFRPEDHATRAEAAAICARLHEYLLEDFAADTEPELEPEQEPEDDDRPGGYFPPFFPNWGYDDDEDIDDDEDDENDQGGTTTRYHKITFADPADDTYAADAMPGCTMVESGSLIYNLPLPERSNYVFCGWFYDEELTQLAAATDTINADMTLYPKMAERTGSEEEVWPEYALNYVMSRDVDPDFTVQVQASSEQQIRDSVTFAAFSALDGKIEYDIVNEGNGIYTLKPEGGLVPGDTYQIVAEDRDREPQFNADGSIAEQDYILFVYDGEVMPSAVQYYNITVACEEYSNMRIDDDVIFLPFEQVSGLDLENAMLYSMSEEGFEINDKSGTFVYYGNALSVGDVVAIYDGILDEETREVDGELAYVKITSINGNTYEYGVPGLQEVIFTPLALPIPLDDTATEEVDGAFFNEDGTVTVYNEYLDFSDFAEYEMLSLNGETTAEVGDYLVLYTGDLETADDHTYYEITDIRYGGSSAVTTFTVIERDEITPVSVYEVYTGDLGITDKAIAELEAETKKQAIESGFAEEAANYLAAVLLSGEEMQETFAGYTLKSMNVRSGSSEDREWYEGGEWNPNVGEDQSLTIEAGAIEAGIGTLMVEVGRVDVHVDSSTTLEEITSMGKGLRLELGLTFSVQIGNYIVGTGWADCINLQVSASFVQEVAFSPYAKVTAMTDTFLGIPYLEGFRIKAGVDVGTYVGVGGTFTVISADDFDSTFPWEQAIKQLDPDYDPGCPNVDSIARQIRNMMGDETTFQLGNGQESLVSIYRDLLEKEIDYVEILAIRCPGCPIKIALPYKIGHITINLELVISAKMSVTVGLAMETLSARRYEFNAWINIIELEAGYSTNDMDLQTPYTEMNLYIMGNIGLRVGPRISLSIHFMSVAETGKKKLDLANAGFSIYFGYTVDMYGIYFMHVRVEDGKVTEGSRCVGALEANHGIFLDLDFHLGVILDLIAVDLHILDLTWNILDKKGTPKVFEATKRTHDAQMWNFYPYYISNHLLNMNTLTVKTGESSRRLDLSHRNFNVELSNPYFTYNPADGSITVTAPVGSVKEECEVRMTYLGSDTLFSVTPITVTINLTWEKTWPSYFIRFCSSNLAQENGEYLPIYWEPPIQEYKVVEGDTITGIEPPSMEIAGYDFLGWYYMDDILEGVKNPTLLSDLNNLEGYIMPASDINMGARFEARTDTPYKLNYYVETVAGTGAYELYKSVTHTATTDSYIPAAGLISRTKEDLGEMDGFKLRYDLLPSEVHVYGDGSGSGDIYLDREKYSVYYHITNKDYAGASVIQTSGLYGAELTSPPDLFNADVPGWSFVGWTDSEGNPVEIPDTVPTDTGKKSVSINGTQYTDGTHYFAQWEPSFNYYTVNHYVMTPDGEYELVESQVGSDSNPAYGGYTGGFIEISEHVKNFDGAQFSYYVCTAADGVETCRIAGVPGTGADDKQHNGQVMDIYYNREYFRVYWDSADGEILQYYYPGQTIVAPEDLTAEEKTGYMIDGWKNIVTDNEIYREGNELVMGTLYKHFEPNYIPAEGTKYTVIHKRPVDGTFGDFSDEDMWETVVGYGTTDTIVTPEVKHYDGFVSPDAQELYINADGTACITYEYVRETYQLTLDFDGGTEVSHARNYYYDVSFRLPMNITREGYAFKGWKLTTEGCEADIDEYDGYVYGSCLTSMQDLSFVAQWEAKPISYKVEHHLEQLDGSYDLQQTDMPTGTIGESVTAYAAEFSGFSYDAENANNVTSGSIAADGSLTLKLYYTRNSYDAEWYDYDGTTLLTTTQVKYEEIISAPEVTVTRDGYTFGGWSIGSVAMTTNGASFNTMDHGIWTANTYTVVFDANGGDGTMDDQLMTYDQTADLPANVFNREGYTFDGWSLTADGEAIYVDRDQVSNLTAEADGIVTLYAQWTGGEGTAYKVEYYLENLAGDGYDMQEETFAGVTGSTVTANAKEISGFTFDSDDTQNVLSGDIAGDGSLSLKLYYTRNSYTLTLDFGAESIKAMAPQRPAEEGFIYPEDVLAHPELAESTKTITLKYGQSLEEVLPDKDYEVSIFAGIEHYTNAEGYWSGYTDIYETSDLENAFPGYTFGGWDVEADATMPAEDMVLTAQWKPMEVKVTFFADYGTTIGEPLTKTYSYGDVIPLSNNPSDYGFVKDGSFISGWNYAFAASDGAVITGELVLIDAYYSYYGDSYSVSGGGWDGNEIEPAEVHIYAFWSNETSRSTITFNGNGATNVAQYKQDVDGGGDYYTMLLKNKYTREGYRFTGWSTEADGSGDWYNDCDGPVTAWDKETTLYAQWEKLD